MTVREFAREVWLGLSDAPGGKPMAVLYLIAVTGFFIALGVGVIAIVKGMW